MSTFSAVPIRLRLTCTRTLHNCVQVDRTITAPLKLKDGTGAPITVQTIVAAALIPRETTPNDVEQVLATGAHMSHPQRRERSAHSATRPLSLPAPRLPRAPICPSPPPAPAAGLMPLPLATPLPPGQGQGRGQGQGHGQGRGWRLLLLLWFSTGSSHWDQGSKVLLKESMGNGAQVGTRDLGRATRPWHKMVRICKVGFDPRDVSQTRVYKTHAQAFALLLVAG